MLIVTKDGVFNYYVQRTSIVMPQDVWVLDPTNYPALTLVTCYPFNYIGSAPKRFIVRASLRATEAPARSNVSKPAERVVPVRAKSSVGRTAASKKKTASVRSTVAKPPRATNLQTKRTTVRDKATKAPSGAKSLRNAGKARATD